MGVLNEKRYKKLLIMYDPDAYKGTIHWCVSNIIDDINKGNILIPYKGPAPPPKTGNHRYIFELYEQQLSNYNPIKERLMSIEKLRHKLELDKPIEKIQFISKNVSGGRRRKTLKNKIKKRRKSRRRY